MQYALVIVFLLLLNGCSTSPIAGSTHFYYTASLRYEQVDKDGWTLIPARAGEWRADYYRSYLPTYFSNDDVRRINYGFPRNFFHALYQLNDDSVLALYVLFSGAFYIDKFVFRSFWGTYEGEKFGEHTPHGCDRRMRQRISASFNAVDVNFDSGSLYFMINGQKIEGTIIQASKRAPSEMWLKETYAHKTYNLATAKNIQHLQPDPRHPINLSTFEYVFSLTCTDLENAVLVIDGLHHQGERLPSLKVRLNYLDFAKVPKYSGSTPVRAVQ